jgi:hypothetical protein
MKSIAIAILFLLLIYPRAIADAGQPQLPADVTISKETGYGRHILINIRLQDGEVLPFAVDTGLPITILDESLKSKLGKRLGVVKLSDWGAKQRGGIYAAPKLYLGNALLMTGSNVVTCDLRKLFPKHPALGILGMDCLEHYCIQLDFAAGKMRFLNPEQVDTSGPGAYSLIFSSAGQGSTNFVRTYIHHTGLIGGQGSDLLIDTGEDIDGALAPDILQEQELKPKEHGIKRLDKTTWYFRDCMWDGETYTNLIVGEAASGVAGKGANVLGLRFLARHLVTFDFPAGVMYLQQQSVGPVPNDNYLQDDARMNALIITGDKLPADIETRINTVLDGRSLSIWVRWFGGTINIKRDGDTRSFHYAVVRKNKHSPWKLKRAWCTDESGDTIETYQVP